MSRAAELHVLEKEFESNVAFRAPSVTEENPRWYAIHTVARHEKCVTQQLQESGIVAFLPLMRQIRQWSDRRARVDVPLFSCYAFVRTHQTADGAPGKCSGFRVCWVS